MLPVTRVSWLDGGRHAPGHRPRWTRVCDDRARNLRLLASPWQPGTLAGTQCAQGAVNPSPLRARGPTCAWRSRASGRISSSLPGRQRQVAAVPSGPGAGIGTNRLIPAHVEAIFTTPKGAFILENTSDYNGQPIYTRLAACVAFNTVAATLLVRSHETGPEFEAQRSNESIGTY
jgi:hypothetical protein